MKPNAARVNRPRILVVEDSPELAFGLQKNFEFEGYDVTTAGDGVKALELIFDEPPDIMILDLMLPGLHGFEALQRVRAAGHDFPVLILSALTTDTTRVAAFRHGADDYVPKPFSIAELSERAKARLRTACIDRKASGQHRIHGRITVGSAIVDLRTRTVEREGRSLTMTRKEFELLEVLLESGDNVVTKEELLERVWGYKAAVETRTLDFHVGELRNKIEQDSHRPRHLVTVRAVGYRLIL